MTDLVLLALILLVGRPWTFPLWGKIVWSGACALALAAVIFLR